MTATFPVSTMEYRVVLVDPRSRNIFAVECENRNHLIRIMMHHDVRAAQHLQSSLRDAWGVSALILDILTIDSSTSPCAIAELLDNGVPASLTKIQPAQLSSDDFSEEEQAQLRMMLDRECESPFANLGWIGEAIAWVENATGKKASSKTSLEQYNASGTSALIRFGMESGCSYWLKASGAPHRHERPITSLLSELCPAYLPEVVAERSDWNAWLMRDEATSISPSSKEASVTSQLLESAVASLAELQVRTARSEIRLLQAGAADHRTSVLRSKAEELFTYIDEAMGFQTSKKVAPVETKRLREIQKVFEAVCDAIQRLNLPDTVLHGDMSLGNILFMEGHCVFIDWAETYMGNPLITFEHLLLLNSIDDPSEKAACDRRLRKAYRSAMSRICDPRAIDGGFACIPLIAAVSAIVGRGDWFKTSLRNDPRRQAYVRAVARYMDHAAHELTLLETLSI